MITNSLILVAGGDAADRETILQALNDEFHVVAAQTIEDALAHTEDSVGLVICDLESTKVSYDEEQGPKGPAAANAIRGDHQW